MKMYVVCTYQNRLIEAIVIVKTPKLSAFASLLGAVDQTAHV